MKKLLSSVLAVVLCFSVICPVMAAEDDFVPSISYKGAPELVADEDGNYGIMMLSTGDEEGVGEDCLVVTPISEVEGSENIPEDEQEAIMGTYKMLRNGSNKLPYEGDAKDKDMVIRDLFDVRLVCNDGHAEKLAEEGTVLELTFKLGVDADEEVDVMVYVDGEWVPAARVINNGDGTVSIAFEELGLVAISVPAEVESAKTGDSNNVTLWIVVMLAAVVALVAAMVVKHKSATSK